MSHLQVDQLEVGKHVKIHYNGCKLDVHAGNSGIGMWLTKDGNKPDENTIGMFIGPHDLPYFMIYPTKDYWESGLKMKLPFAFTSEGVQIPHPDGTRTFIKFKEISDLVKLLPKSN